MSSVSLTILSVYSVAIMLIQKGANININVTFVPEELEIKKDSDSTSNINNTA